MVSIGSMGLLFLIPVIILLIVYGEFDLNPGALLLILALFSITISPMLLILFTGFNNVRNPSQEVSLKIDMDDKGFTKWVRGELLYSQIEGQLNESGISFTRHRPIFGDRVYRLNSGIKIDISHGESILVEEEGERPVVWIMISVGNIRAQALREGQVLQGLLDNLPMFGYNEFTRADILRVG